MDTRMDYDLYSTSYYLDLEKNTYTMLSKESQVNAFLSKSGNLRQFVNEIVEITKDDKEKDFVREKFSLESMRKLLTEHIFVFLTIYTIYGEEIKFTASAAGKDENGVPNRALLVATRKNKKYEYEKVMNVALNRGNDYELFKRNLESMDSIDGSLVSMNIRSFHTITTIIGIDETNKLLVKIREIIEKILLPGEYAAQINADNYVIFMEEIRREVIEKRLENLTKQIRNNSLKLDNLVIQPFYGVIAWDGKSDIEFAYNSANSAKKDIRKNVHEDIAFFDYSLAEIMKDNKRLEDSFYDAIEHHEFEVWYQPRFDARTETIVAAEALVRWKRDGKLIYPDTFIPLFEKNGMIRMLDNYVFEQVCIWQKERIEQGKHLVPISVNLSRASLYYQDIVEQYDKLIKKIDIDKRLIPLEITETAALDTKYIKKIDEKFHELGFTLQIDDFGAGYSSFSSLLEMHIDTVKIDKSLIDHLSEEKGQKMIYHIVAMAKDMGMHITAEGVEDYEQFISLKTMGCDTIQGYYFSYPLPRDQFEDLLNVESMIEKKNK